MPAEKKFVENILKHPDMTAMIILVVVSFALRVYNISFQSFWTDEGATYYFSQMPFVKLLSIVDFSPPFFYMLEHLMVSFFGESEVVLRMPSAIAGALSVAAAYAVVNKMFGSRMAALLAALLLAFSPVHIIFSQEARMYTIVILFFLCELYFYLDVLKTDNKRSWLMFVLFAWLGLCFSYYAIIPTLLLFIYWIYLKKDSMFAEDLHNLKTVVKYGSFFLLLSFPLIYLMIGTYAVIVGSGAWSVSGIDLTAQILSSFMYRSLVLSPVLLSLVVLGLFVCRKKYPEQFGLITFLIVVSVILPTVLSLFITLAVRHVLFSLILFYAAMACCLFAARSEAEQKKLFLVGVVGIVVLGAALLPSYYSTPRSDDFRGAAAALDEKTSDGDIILYVPNNIDLMYGSLSFYFKNPEVNFLGAETTEEIETVAAPAISDGKKVFIVTWSTHNTFSEERYTEMMTRIHDDGFTVNLWFSQRSVSVYEIM